MKILLYGKPGVGKTTLLTRFIAQFDGESDGFFTRRMRDQNGVNWGFEVVTLQGDSRILAHKSLINSPYIIGSGHHVDVGVIDHFIVPKLIQSFAPSKVIIIDEIGRMEALSPRFIETVSKVLGTNLAVLGTIVNENEEWSLQFKENKECILVEVTEVNRDKLIELLLLVFGGRELFNKLKDEQKAIFRLLLSEYFKTNSEIQIKKLYRNALPYLLAGQINKVGDSRFVVTGNNGDHQVFFSDKTIECDCELFKGVGAYVGKAGECSHIQAVKIFTS